MQTKRHTPNVLDGAYRRNPTDDIPPGDECSLASENSPKSSFIWAEILTVRQGMS